MRLPNGLSLLLEALKNAQGLSGSITFISRKKKAEDITLALHKTEATPAIGNRLLNIVKVKLEALAKEDDLLIAPYSLDDSFDSRSVLRLVDMSQVPQCADLIGRLTNHASIPMLDNIEVLAPQLWAYAVTINNYAQTCVLFRKFSGSNVLKASGLNSFILGSGHLDVLDTSVLTIDNELDCICIDKDIYILDPIKFESIFDFFTDYQSKAHSNIPQFKLLIDNPMLLLEKGKTDPRKMKALAAAASGQSCPVSLVPTMIHKYNLQIDFDSATGVIKMSNSRDWDVIKLLKNDFLLSETTDERFEVGSKRKRA